MSVTKFSIAILTLLFAGFGAGSHAAAEKKIALVVGIDSYDNPEQRSQLKKARADALAVAQSLKSLGFEVIHREELGRSAFNKAWQEFLDKLSPGDTAAFFFPATALNWVVGTICCHEMFPT